MPATKENVKVGKDVWPGIDALIPPGVDIGRGAVVETRSVLTRDFPPYTIVAGSPANVQRYRLDSEIVSELLQVTWWTWSQENVRVAVPLLSSPNIERFLAEFSVLPRISAGVAQGAK
jgi:chloramphenicol O-acetyltransferase type B